MTDLRGSSFVQLLPPNLHTPHTRALSAALDRQTQRLSDMFRHTLLLADVSALDEDLCDLVALHFNIQAYSSQLDLEQKRGIIQSAFAISAKKGTMWAVERLVLSLFPDGGLSEWFEYGGEPHYFKAELYEHLDKEKKARFLDALSKTRRMSSWLEAVKVTLSGSAQNENRTGEMGLRVRGWAKNRRGRPVCFDGSRRFDREIRFDQDYAPSFFLRRLTVRSGTRQPMGTSGWLLRGESYVFDGELCFDGRKKFNAAGPAYNRFDDQFCFDGARDFGPVPAREEF